MISIPIRMITDDDKSSLKNDACRLFTFGGGFAVYLLPLVDLCKSGKIFSSLQ